MSHAVRQRIEDEVPGAAGGAAVPAMAVSPAAAAAALLQAPPCMPDVSGLGSGIVVIRGVRYLGVWATDEDVALLYSDTTDPRNSGASSKARSARFQLSRMSVSPASFYNAVHLLPYYATGGGSSGIGGKSGSGGGSGSGDISGSEDGGDNSGNSSADDDGDDEGEGGAGWHWDKVCGTLQQGTGRSWSGHGARGGKWWGWGQVACRP